MCSKTVLRDKEVYEGLMKDSDDETEIENPHDDELSGNEENGSEHGDIEAAGRMWRYVASKRRRFREARQNSHNLWSTCNPSSGRPIYQATMSRNRFTEILRFLRFDDIATRSERKQTGKLAPIREVTDILAKNWKAGEIEERNQGLQAVKTLASHWYGSGRNITTDNFSLILH
ncbi:hypothetical protein CBL_11624 [Carabus blaptoides fortunei]